MDFEKVIKNTTDTVNSITSLVEELNALKVGLSTKEELHKKKLESDRSEFESEMVNAKAKFESEMVDAKKKIKSEMAEMKATLETVSDTFKCEMAEVKAKLEAERDAFNEEKNSMATVFKAQTTHVRLNVGGTKVETCIPTISKGSRFFEAMFDGKYENVPAADGFFFVDRDGRHFADILYYLREPNQFPSFMQNWTNEKLTMIICEAKHFMMDKFVAMCENEREARKMKIEENDELKKTLKKKNAELKAQKEMKTGIFKYLEFRFPKGKRVEFSGKVPTELGFSGNGYYAIKQLSDTTITVNQNELSHTDFLLCHPRPGY